MIHIPHFSTQTTSFNTPFHAPQPPSLHSIFYNTNTTQETSHTLYGGSPHFLLAPPFHNINISPSSTNTPPYVSLQSHTWPPSHIQNSDKETPEAQTSAGIFLPV